MRLVPKNNWMMFLIGVVCLIHMTAGFPLPAAKAAPGASVVEAVRVEMLTNAPTSPRVTRRMADSVQTIGEHLLLGRTTREVADQREQYERLVRDVFDRVLAGYTVERVTLEAAPVSVLRIGIAPWGDTVRQVDIQVDYSGLLRKGSPWSNEIWESWRKRSGWLCWGCRWMRSTGLPVRPAN